MRCTVGWCSIQGYLIARPHRPTTNLVIKFSTKEEPVEQLHPTENKDETEQIVTLFQF